MSRSATCPKCGGRITVPGGFAGAQIACPACGATFRLRAAAPKARPTTPPRPPVTTDDDLPTDARGEPLYPCGMCGGSFPPERVYDANGLVLCHDCYARSIAPAPEAPPMTAPPPDESAQAPPPPAPPARSVRWLIPAGIVAAVAVVAAGVLLSGVFQAKPIAPVASAESSRVKLRDFSTLTAPPKQSTEAKGPPNVARQIDAVWQEAKAAAERDEFAAADAKYKQVFDLLESQAGQPVYRSLAGDLIGARREWDAVRGRLGTLAPPSNAMAPSSPTHELISPTPAVAAVPQAENASGGAPTARTSRRAPRKALDEAQVLELLTAAGQAARAGQKLNAAVLYKQAYDLLGDSRDDAPRSDALQTALVNAAATRKALLAEVKELPETRDLALSALLTRGNAALATAHWQAALEALADARQMVEEQAKAPERNRDDRYLQALHGMAVAYLRLNDISRAGDLFDDRSPLGRAVKEKLDSRQRGAAASRDLVYNRAVVDMIQKFNAMRAVRGVKDYLAAQDKAAPVDEEMLDLLGTAMFLASESGRAGEGNRLMKEAEALYAEQLKRLEATRPGKRRWGAEWLPAGAVAKLVAEKQRAVAAVQTAQHDLDAAQRQLATAKKGHLPRGGVGMQFFVVNPAEVKAAETQVGAAKERLTIAKAAVPREPWKPRPEPTLPAAAYAMAHPPPPPVATQSVAAGPAPTTPIAPPDPAPPSTSTEVVAAAPAPPPPPRVQRNAIAFAVDRTHLVTAADVVGDAESVRLEDADGGSFRARVATKQGALALLEVNAKDVSGGSLPTLALAADFRGGPVRCATIPSASLFLPSVELLGGTAAPPPPQGAWQVSLERHPRLPGAPLVDGAGKVVGVITARRDAPPTQLPAATLTELRAFLQTAGALPAPPAGSADPARVFHVIVEQ